MTTALFSASPPAAKPEFVTKGNVAYHAIDRGRLDDAPYVEAENELEKLFDKNQLKKRLRQWFDTDAFHTFIKGKNLSENITPKFCIDLCVTMAIHKRAIPSTLIGILYRHFETDQGKHVAMQACAHALEECVDADLVDYNMNAQMFIIRIDIDPVTRQDLDRYQYPLPMVVQPKKLNNNMENGYRSAETGRSLVILKAGRQALLYEQANVCLDHLNRMNSIPLTLNIQTAELIDNEWADIGRRRPGETFQQYETRQKAFEKYDIASKDVMYALMGIRNQFWMTHKYDRRGRTYCQGYHVNYQGTSWNKAVVEFANKELIENRD